MEQHHHKVIFQNLMEQLFLSNYKFNNGGIIWRP